MPRTHNRLVEGQTIATVAGTPLEVVRELGRVGSKRTYAVTHDGQQRALTWFGVSSPASDGPVPRESFLRNLQSQFGAERPSGDFLWPLDLVVMDEGSFGYVSELAPTGHMGAQDLLLHRTFFASFRRATDACLAVVRTFLHLHERGLCYHGIDAESFLVSPRWGKVALGSPEFIGPCDESPSACVDPRFMAPEVVRGQSVPGMGSDRFVMASLLYLFLCLGHPLEGRRAVVPVPDAGLQLRLYGTEPAFAMGPDASDNAADPVAHATTLTLWQWLPAHVRDEFGRAFCPEALLDADARPDEVEWLRTLARFRSDILRCTCGTEVFCQDGEGVCGNCGSTIHASLVLDLHGYAMPLTYDTRIYGCQLSASAPDLERAVLRVVRTGDGQLAVQNASQVEWRVESAAGEGRCVAPGDVTNAEPGTRLLTEDATIAIRAYE